MNNKDDVSKVNIDNADEICSKIKEESSEEAGSILAKAHKEKERLLFEASKAAQEQASRILQDNDEKIKNATEKAFSIINMEKRKISLEGKSLFVDDVIAAVKKEAENYRANANYEKFLKEAILEGVMIIGETNVQVFYSPLDEDLIARFKNIPVEFKKGSFLDLGVTVQSPDGRVSFDNTFSARLKRAYDEIYVNLLREAM